jgi:hypothetical protein
MANQGLINGLNPLSYMGVNPLTPPEFITANHPPTGGDYRGLQLGTFWLDTSTHNPPTVNDVYVLVGVSGIAPNVATWDSLGNAAGLQSITGNDAVVNTGPAINLVGAGVINVASGPANTLTITSAGGGALIPWTVEAGAGPIAMAINNGYIANNAGTITFNLPAVSAVGSVLVVTGINNPGGWRIGQAAGQSVLYVNGSTTVGVAGYVVGTFTADSVSLVCTVANTQWVIYAFTGNINVN